MLIKEAAVAYAPHGIRVNGVAPGHIETDDKKVAAGQPTLNPYIPLGRRSGLPQDIEKAVCFLADPVLSGFITGQVIIVDGGGSLIGEWAMRLPPHRQGP